HQPDEGSRHGHSDGRRHGQRRRCEVSVHPQRSFALIEVTPMPCRFALITMLSLAAAACALNTRPTMSPAAMAELWQEPIDLEQRDLLHGPGGASLGPDPRGRYTLLKSDPSGFRPGCGVRGQ